MTILISIDTETLPQFSFKLNVVICIFPTNLPTMMSLFRKKKKQETNDVKKQADCDTESFVFKTHSIPETTKKTIAIHDFSLKIEHKYKSRDIISPKFKLAGIDFSIDVIIRFDDIGVYLHNYSNEEQMFSFTVKEASGGMWRGEKFMVGAVKRIALVEKVLSHKQYIKWSKDNGDVFKLEVLLTLHRTEGDGWTR